MCVCGGRGRGGEGGGVYIYICACACAHTVLYSELDEFAHFTFCFFLFSLCFLSCILIKVNKTVERVALVGVSYKTNTN